MTETTPDVAADASPADPQTEHGRGVGPDSGTGALRPVERDARRPRRRRGHASRGGPAGRAQDHDAARKTTPRKTATPRKVGRAPQGGGAQGPDHPDQHLRHDDVDDPAQGHAPVRHPADAHGRLDAGPHAPVGRGDPGLPAGRPNNKQAVPAEVAERLSRRPDGGSPTPPARPAIDTPVSDVITEIDNQVDAQAEQLSALRRAVAAAEERLTSLEAAVSATISPTTAAVPRRTSAAEDASRRRRPKRRRPTPRRPTRSRTRRTTRSPRRRRTTRSPTRSRRRARSGRSGGSGRRSPAPDPAQGRGVGPDLADGSPPPRRAR